MPEFVQQSLAFLEPALPHRVGQATVDYRSTREILTRATGFMDAYDYTLNPYTGCSFGCTYCYAAFFSRTPKRRETWGRWVSVKKNAVARLRRRQDRLDGKLIYMSSVTDPYQPIERKLKLTRQLLAVLADRHRPKLVVQTRSPDVVRDIDMFARIVDGGGQVQVNMTVTTDDEDVRKTFEPHCPANHVRLDAVRTLHAAGINTCITMTPLLLVLDAFRFAMALTETGIDRFIAQPFHFQSGRFVAGTRDAALHMMAKKLDCDVNAVRQRYLEHYGETSTILERRLPNLGRGKEGFQPPF